MFTEDQKLTFEYLGNNYLATVTGTLVESQEEKQSAHRGCVGLLASDAIAVPSLT